MDTSNSQNLGDCPIQNLQAGEFAQSSLVSPAATLGAATSNFSQTLLDGVYDVVAPVVQKVKARVKKFVDSSPPVQLSIFDVLRDWAKAHAAKLQRDYFRWSLGSWHHFPNRKESDGVRLTNKIEEFKVMWGLCGV